jgi:hypothetical protein
MAPASYRHDKLLAARKLDSRDDIRNTGTLGDQGRVFIDHAVPYFAGAVIGIITRYNHFTMQVSLEIL